MATVSIPACTSALLLDIEGTTTPITFVKVSFIKLSYLFQDDVHNNLIAALANYVAQHRLTAAMLTDGCHQ